MPYARERYTGNGSTTSFSITFPFISPSHVKVSVNGVEQTTGFSVSGGSVVFAVAPASAASVDIVRDSSRGTRLANFIDAAVLTAASLNRDSMQAVYMAQEALDAAEVSLKEDATGQFDADGKRIINLAAPSGGNDAATKAYVDAQTAAPSGSAAAAVITANQALATANAAAAVADVALPQSQAALDSAWATAASLVTTTNTANSASSAAATAQATANLALRTDGLLISGDYTALNRKILNLAAPVSATDAATKGYVDSLLAGPPSTPPSEALSVGLGEVSNLTGSGFTLSMNVAGTPPVGSVMLLQWATNVATGPWAESPTPAALPGVFSHAFTGASPGARIYWRGFVYTPEPGGSINHAVTPLGSFDMPAPVGGDQPSYSAMLADIDDPSEGRSMRWVSFANNPDNVQYVGGPSGRPVPAVIGAGAVARGTTIPDYSTTGIPSEYLDSDRWPLYTPWVVVLEEGDLATGTTRLHTDANTAMHFERAIFLVWRNATSSWQTIRDRSDLQTWYTADEPFLIANGSVETRAPTAAEGASGIVVRWPTGSGNAVHGSLKNGPIGFPMSEFENGINLSSIVADIGCVAFAYRIRLVPWQPSVAFNPANARLMAHVGCDARVIDPHPWGMPPHVLSRQRRLTAGWAWHTAITLSDTIRSDRRGGPSAEAGFTMAEAVSRPIPGWLA